jgi:hypothetical protein
MILSCPHCDAKAKSESADCSTCGRRMSRACPACAETISAKATACKYCGEEVAALRVAAPKPSEPGIRFEDERPATPAVPWEDASRGLLRRWWGTWAAVSFSPSSFFRSMPANSGQSWPVGFAYGLTAQFLAVTALALIVVGGVSVAAGRDISAHVRWSSVALFTAAIPASFLAVTVVLYAASLLWHVLLKLLGAKGGFQTTLRVVSYSSAADGWLLLPFLGLLIAPFVKTAAHYQGFRQAHGLGRFRAAFAALVPWALLFGGLAVALSHGCCEGASGAVSMPDGSF